MVDKVVIVGGGLGGLAAALQLRSQGIDAHVYERNESILGGPGTGTIVSLFPNGCRALAHAQAQLVRRMEEQGHPDGASLVVNNKGEPIPGAGWGLSTRMRATYGYPMVAILWRDALRVLAEALPEECVHTGHEFLEVTSGPDSATAVFRHGQEVVPVTGALVVGADGIRSRVRDCLFGPMQPRDQGRTMWRAVVDRELCSGIPAVQGHAGAVAGAAAGRTVFIVVGVKQTLYWALSLADDASDGRAKERSRDQEHAKERVLEEFRDWSFAADIVRATDPKLILERRVIDLPVLKKWYKGRVVLLGDAAHAVPPSLGQGANLAYEDGLELAKQLSSPGAKEDVEAALRRYEQVRIPRVQRVSDESQKLLSSRAQDFYDWLYSYDTLAAPAAAPAAAP